MASSSRARAAGRRFLAGGPQTGMAIAGGVVYFGAHTLLSPTIYGTDPANVTKRCWWLPAAGVIGGHVIAKASKLGSVGLGLAGGAAAIGAQQIQMGISIKKNAAASGTSGVGALLEPREINALQPASGVGEVDDAGALWGPPSLRGGVHEAAGLSL